MYQLIDFLLTDREFVNGRLDDWEFVNGRPEIIWSWSCESFSVDESHFSLKQIVTLSIVYRI